MIGNARDVLRRIDRPDPVHRDLIQLLDAVGAGVGLYDLTGALVHSNSEMTRLELSPSLTREILRFVERCVAMARERRLHPLSPVVRLAEEDHAAPEGTFRLRGSYFGSPLFGREALLLVTLLWLSPPALSDEELRSSYALSPREILIARLLAAGRSNAEIAGELHISPSTARNHTRQVLQKLGVHSRARVGALLRHPRK